MSGRLRTRRLPSAKFTAAFHGVVGSAASADDATCPQGAERSPQSISIIGGGLAGLSTLFHLLDKTTRATGDSHKHAHQETTKLSKISMETVDRVHGVMRLT